jgi:general stress protein YciG
MDRTKQKEIASKGGKAAHQKGTAHEWTSEEAREAGRKGGMASHRRRKEMTDQPMGSGESSSESSSESSMSQQMPESMERAGGDDTNERTR